MNKIIFNCNMQKEYLEGSDREIKSPYFEASIISFLLFGVLSIVSIILILFNKPGLHFTISYLPFILAIIGMIVLNKISREEIINYYKKNNEIYFASKAKRNGELLGSFKFNPNDFLIARHTRFSRGGSYTSYSINVKIFDKKGKFADVTDPYYSIAFYDKKEDAEKNIDYFIEFFNIEKEFDVKYEEHFL